MGQHKDLGILSIRDGELLVGLSRGVTWWVDTLIVSLCCHVQNKLKGARLEAETDQGALATIQAGVTVV